MKLKFEGQISTRKLNIYEEKDLNDSVYRVSVESDDKEHFIMKVTDKCNRLVGEVHYKEDVHRKFLMVHDYIINILGTNEQIKVKAEKGKNIVFGEGNAMYLARSIRDRKMRFYDDGKLIMVLKCKTLIRNWLRGDYVAEVFDDKYIVLCVCAIAIALNVVFDEHNCTSFNP